MCVVYVCLSTDRHGSIYSKVAQRGEGGGGRER